WLLELVAGYLNPQDASHSVRDEHPGGVQLPVTSYLLPVSSNQRYPSRSSRKPGLGIRVPLPRAISRSSLSTITPSPTRSRFVRLTTVPRAIMVPDEIGRRK